MIFPAVPPKLALFTKSIWCQNGQWIRAGGFGSFSWDEDIDEWKYSTAVDTDPTNGQVCKYNEKNVKFRNNHVHDSISAFIKLKSSSGIVYIPMVDVAFNKLKGQGTGLKSPN